MSRRPVIGISSRKIHFTHNDRPYPRYGVSLQYVHAVEHAGGLPLILPMTQAPDVLAHLLDVCDGLLLTGGHDVDPSWYNEEPHRKIGSIDPVRDITEMMLCKDALRRDLPILGVCRGHQVLNVAAGGSLWQDVESQIGDQVLEHFQELTEEFPSHSIQVVPGSWLHGITRSEKVRINSYHHQAVKDLAPGFVVTARSPDGIIEAISSPNYEFVHGVQWHPELLWNLGDFNFALFRAHVDAAALFAARRTPATVS